MRLSLLLFSFLSLPARHHRERRTSALALSWRVSSRGRTSLTREVQRTTGLVATRARGARLERAEKKLGGGRHLSCFRVSRRPFTRGHAGRTGGACERFREERSASAIPSSWSRRAPSNARADASKILA